MEEVIELSFDSPDGIIDCRLEPEHADGKLFYTATVLYPNVVNGFSRSEIYVYNLQFDPATAGYFFDAGEDGVHPKIKKLEKQISNAINKSR